MAILARGRARAAPNPAPLDSDLASNRPEESVWVESGGCGPNHRRLERVKELCLESRRERFVRHHACCRAVRPQTPTDIRRLTSSGPLRPVERARTAMSTWRSCSIVVCCRTRVSRTGWGSWRSLGSALRRSDVDVVILNEAPPLLAHRVLSRGVLAFERSRSARVQFQVRTAARYLDLMPMFETHIRYLKRNARRGRIIG